MSNFWDELMGDDEHAATYMETYGEGVGCETRHTLGSLINDGETVLDVGCGPGWNYDHFMKYGPEVDGYQGVDYSERFVRVANARNPMPELHVGGQPDLFVVGDCRKLEEEDESWDVVILQDVLEHTNGYERPIHEALRVAKKRVIVAFWHLTENDDHINDDGNDGWGAWYSRPKWEEFLNSLGYVWMEHQINANNRARDFYIIRKEGDDE